MYLLIVDYFSRYIEVARLNRTTAGDVILHTKAVFARHGIPEVVVSDNGPQFSSEAYTSFARQYRNRLRESEERSKRQQQSNYDHHYGVRPLAPLAAGQRVWVPDRSEEAHVVQEAGTRSYEVQTSQGLYRRNRRALIDLPSSDQTEQSDSDSPNSEILPEPHPSKDTHPTDQPDPPVRRSSRVSRPPDRLDPSF